MDSVRAPRSKEELERCLSEVVSQAYSNGVEVADAGYSLGETGDGIPRWDLQIIRVENPREESDE